MDDRVIAAAFRHVSPGGAVRMKPLDRLPVRIHQWQPIMSLSGYAAGNLLW